MSTSSPQFLKPSYTLSAGSAADVCGGRLVDEALADTVIDGLSSAG